MESIQRKADLLENKHRPQCWTLQSSTVDSDCVILMCMMRRYAASPMESLGDNTMQLLELYAYHH